MTGSRRRSVHPCSNSQCVFVVRALATLMFLALVQLSSSDSAPNKLLLILVDGVRWDYFEKFSSGELPGFNKLRQNGVAAEALIPVFPSLSLVNYYSIMTGLYAGTNGMIDNYMYDIRHNEYFLIGNNEDQYHSYWWNDGEPLWITATKQDKRSYFWFWNGCEVEILGHRPTFCSPYQSTPNPSIGNFSLALDEAIAVLNNGSADLAGVFIEKVDDRGHIKGPNSDEVKEAMKEVDAELVRAIQAVEEAGDINMMVFSDHGMSERVGGPDDATSGLVNVLDYINSTDWEYAIGSSSTPTLQIWPKSDNEEWLYERLRSAHPHMTVYKKQDIPDRYHFKEHYRVPPLYLLTDEGYGIAWKDLTRELKYIGYHGYDNTGYRNMHGIYFALGPDFKSGATFKAGRFINVHLYQLMCHVMQLKPAPHNGTWSTVCDALVDTDACEDGPYSGTTSMAVTSWRQDPASFSLIIVVAVIAALFDLFN